MVCYLQHYKIEGLYDFAHDKCRILSHGDWNGWRILMKPVHNKKILRKHDTVCNPLNQIIHEEKIHAD